MEKSFFDVFPKLNLDKKSSELFEQVTVCKVSATKSRDFVRVSIVSDYLIPKETIYKVEKEIKRQFFDKHPVTVKLYESFHLSEQYTPENLMREYESSILLELREYSPVEYNIFKMADLSYPKENQILITAEDTVLARSKSQELLRILEKIIVERCGLKAECLMEYKEKKTGRHKEEDDIMISRQIREITLRAFGKAGAAAEEASEEMQSGAAGRAEGAGEGSSTNAGAIGGTSEKPTEQGKGTVSKGVGEKRPFEKRSFGKREDRGDFRRAIKKSDNPDVIYGRDFEDEVMPMEDIMGEMEVTVKGKIIREDSREIKNERTILMYDITDYTDTMTFKMFVHNDQVAEVKADLKMGAFVKLKGIAAIDAFDKELTIGSVIGIRKIADFTTSRKDLSVRKRVELHCHTKMSDMDGVSEAKDIVKRAYQWGHPAIAITDHGVVQAFPDANHVWEDLWKAEKAKRKEAGDPNPDKQDFFKIIYGMIP